MVLWGLDLILKYQLILACLDHLLIFYDAIAKKYTGSCSSKSTSKEIDNVLFSFNIPTGYVILFVEATVTKVSDWWGTPCYLKIKNSEHLINSKSLNKYDTEESIIITNNTNFAISSGTVDIAFNCRDFDVVVNSSGSAYAIKYST